VAAVEQTHLEGIDVALEGGDARAGRSTGLAGDDMACSGRALCSFLAPRSAGQTLILAHNRARGVLVAFEPIALVELEVLDPAEVLEAFRFCSAAGAAR